MFSTVYPQWCPVFMYMYVYIYTYICMYIYIHLYYVYTYVCIYICIFLYYLYYFWHRLQENVTAVLTSSPTDVLSHVAIRARSQGVLLATCFDDAALSSIKQLQGKNVRLDVDATGAVTATETAAPAAAADPKQGRVASAISAFVFSSLAQTTWVCSPLQHCKSFFCTCLQQPLSAIWCASAHCLFTVLCTQQGTRCTVCTVSAVQAHRTESPDSIVMSYIFQPYVVPTHTVVCT